ncbi:NADH-quinone oxidoreductase subunit C [Helicobacter sp. 11S02629-2]|uniref:NADH-quinone oxidoreductase subunit C n=1 Tax=Helicobacter sp. 11S02629-2 TaxID=1476195 RepID=UPI000BA5048E|nr:NADH-quinone oxidoreductase subunit C [Helicobacter sp. 11S02629-2]PAF44916.1 NADH dehydrogenase [Helicobacter sp. 11S02629-2]
MIRRKSPSLDVQKKAYHTDRFYEPILSCRTSFENSPFLEIYDTLKSKVKVLKGYVELDQAVFYVEKDELKEALNTLKSLGYDVLSEMSAIDNLAIDNTLEMFYQILSLNESNKHRKRLRVKCSIKDNEDMPSVTSIYKCANWSERECYDMLGIRFEGHPFMKRILMPTDWVGHPLRKSYPLQGDEAASWYEVDKVFGREYRDAIGPEQRDSARIDREDTIHFARIGKEVPRGEKPSETTTEVIYQEARKPLIVKKLSPKKTKKLDKRK